MKPVRPKGATRRAGGQKEKPAIKDPIEVFCRIRPIDNINEAICIQAKDDTTVVTLPPDNSLRGTFKEVHYTFKHVFNESTSQKNLFDYVGLPLVSDLFQGINGLLFTYGITSSGKTFTIAGTPQDPGILPRTLDVIFNSMKDFQAMQYIFKSDKFNRFDIQSPAEALAEKQKEISTKNRQKKNEYLGDWSNRIKETVIVEDLNADFAYATFVSYVEIYNNYIYDLLEDVPTESHTRSRGPQSKMLREDTDHNVYVFTTTELEVITADEALELFCKGQLRRHISHTALNAQSSRSHSVFTVRIVQAPLDLQGAEVMQDKSLVTISQFSIVDLAGSERLIRTRNTGKKQQEAGNINQSLMALRQCIETLRDNQKGGITKMVPYRESKLTQLFKTYFEGEGKIRMIVCVNPQVDNYYETLHVMKFAEVTRDVVISRAVTPISTPVHLSLKPGRGNLFREAIRRVQAEGIPLEDALEPVVYSLGPDFPSLTVNGPDDEETFNTLIEFLNARKARRECLINELNMRQNEFRQNLVAIEKENATLKQENIVLQMDLKAREQQVRDFERKLSSSDEVKHLLQQKLGSTERKIDDMEKKLTERDSLLSKEKEKLKVQMANQMQFEKSRLKRIMEKRLVEKQMELTRQMCFSEEKFRQLREILNFDDWEMGLDGPVSQSVLPTARPSAIPPELTLTRAKTVIGDEDRVRPPSVSSQMKAKSDSHVAAKPETQDTSAVFKKPQQKSVAVANPRHRRSHSSSGNVWLEHKPAGNLELATVLQPKMKKKKSVSKLEVKDVTKNDVSKYVLTHQEQDSQGEVETKLYKGDVIPSAGGGAQVIFNDIEKLRQESPPPTYNLRKRSAENTTLREIEEKCAVSVECHGLPSKVQRKK